MIATGSPGNLHLAACVMPGNATSGVPARIAAIRHWNHDLKADPHE